MLESLVLLIELLLLFSYIRIVLLLYLYKMFGLALYTCAYRKLLVHNTIIDASSTPTNSASVLIFVFSFIFRDTDMIATFPIVNLDPV